MEQVLTNNDTKVMTWNNNFPIHSWIGAQVGLDSDECAGKTFSLTGEHLKALRNVCRKALMNRDRVEELLGAEPSGPNFWTEMKQTVQAVDNLLRNGSDLRHVEYQIFF